MSRARLLLAGRVAFVVLTIGFAWWSFHGRWDDVGDALAATDPLRILGALALTLAGLGLTGVLWGHLLARLGSPVPPVDAAAIFFLGQLGKYIPGSVWTFAAQAQLGRRHAIPARSSIAASALFLMLHTFSGLVLGGALLATGVLETDLPWWVGAGIALGGAGALAPPVLGLVGGHIGGRDVVLRLSSAHLFSALATMALVWTAYGAGIALLGDAMEPSDLLVATGAFALSHAAGVLLVIAPAGLGAREGVLIALLAPAVGLGSAAAVAVLARVVHAVADFLLAAAARAAAHVGTDAEAQHADAR